MNKFLAMAAIAAVTFLSSCGDDDDDNTPTKTLPTSWTGKTLGAQTNSNGSFFSSATGNVYGTADSANFTSNQVDISFAQTGSPTVAKFISLNARRSEGLSRVTTIARATLFSETSMTKSQFDTVSNNVVASMVGTAATVNVAQGKVYSFVNTEGKSGLIYVSLLDNGTGTNGAATIDVKFEK